MSSTSVLKSRKRTLESAKSDLNDDANAIRRTNGNIDSLIGSFESLINCPYTSSIAAIIEASKEPYQDSDSKIISATYYIQQEISAINREIAQNEAAAKSSSSG